MTLISIVAYLALFGTVAISFVLVSLLLGRFVRPSAPSPEKQAIYECGEPAVGSGFVQFDLRFYVVALVFLIFEVEVAFFFPWAAVFGKVVRLTDRNVPAFEAREAYQEFGVLQSDLPAIDSAAAPAPLQTASTARSLALASMTDIGLFFAVLLVGFAYVWKQGDLDWVRAVRAPLAVSGEAVLR
jgi:NADH-quinone oxidoreductase subunit A